MSNFKAWISAARPRTLPLSISGIILGSCYAYGYNAFAKAVLLLGSPQTNDVINQPILFVKFNWWIPVLALITTLGFQVLSNFANDYGDGVKGTDNDDRIGPMRAIQSGLISAVQMKRAMIITACLTAVSAISLIYVSLGLEQLITSLFFLVLGVAAIWAAIKYTVGDNAYGYRGLGDVFVFIFFGPVSVIGVYYLIASQLEWLLLLPSLTIGLLSVAVLNLNNMRDIESDRKAGKNTIPVKIGITNAKRLHYSFIAIALISIIAYIFIIIKTLGNVVGDTEWLWLPILVLPMLLVHIITVYRNKVPALLDPELKKVALSTFFIAILTIIATARVY
ncbi:1,4-dihydroxy-2-naphthoate octaprenyltransferase [Nonlabens ponticola]|uniref:1,4-dihydroxy-2-naphthoate octaprenyltransferase n=1 Tax=Nonlabens ponticola TaxID=2496866 RepID=A0A3S9MZS4_9FLAO|nr:1,4-dihydroxy-2-naphthoate octaprenyltransferase [Nonlabens ponticola]AZQ44667.1 1,4-dihydroxy-2-naphthoate octaprenyltransferase [Nonlabens ponticola]